LNVWGEEKCLQGFCGETLSEDIFENLGLDGRIIFKWIMKK
jgi:hypothetical protein